jgi:hypothetical protein
MLVVAVIQEVSQPLVHTGVVFLAQVPGPGVFGDVLAEELTASAARCRAVPLREGGQRSAQHDQPKQQRENQQAFHGVFPLYVKAGSDVR